MAAVAEAREGGKSAKISQNAASSRKRRVHTAEQFTREVNLPNIWGVPYAVRIHSSPFPLHYIHIVNQDVNSGLNPSRPPPPCACACGSRVWHGPSVLPSFSSWQMECTDFQWLFSPPQIGCDLRPKTRSLSFLPPMVAGISPNGNLRGELLSLSPLFRVICGPEWQRPTTRPTDRPTEEGGKRASPSF